jgi:hypothetical protein
VNLIRDSSGDSSGDITIRGHAGELSIEDSSGDIDVSDISGSIVVERDSSGDIEIEEVGKSVIVAADGGCPLKGKAIAIVSPRPTHGQCPPSATYRGSQKAVLASARSSPLQYSGCPVQA